MQFWLTHPVGCELSDKRAHKFMIHRMTQRALSLHFCHAFWPILTNSHNSFPWHLPLFLAACNPKTSFYELRQQLNVNWLTATPNQPSFTAALSFLSLVLFALTLVVNCANKSGMFHKIVIAVDLSISQFHLWGCSECKSSSFNNANQKIWLMREYKVKPILPFSSINTRLEFLFWGERTEVD